MLRGGGGVGQLLAVLVNKYAVNLMWCFQASRRAALEDEEKLFDDPE